MNEIPYTIVKSKVALWSEKYLNSFKTAVWVLKKGYFSNLWTNLDRVQSLQPSDAVKENFYSKDDWKE